MASASRRHLDLVSVLDEREPVGGLEEHRKHCEAEPGECPFEQKSDDADVIGNANARTERLAPNGKRSNLTERQWHQVRTPEFKAWFGDWENDPEHASKVVDENGEPLVVHRGTPEKAGNVFGYGKSYYGGNRGFWFANSYDRAKWYSYNEYTGEQGDIKSVFLNIRTPLDLRPLSYNTDYKKASNFLESAYRRYIKRFTKTQRVKDIYEKNQDHLYAGPEDGVILCDETSWSYIAKTPTQIKSATDNDGKFDPNNPDIRY